MENKDDVFDGVLLTAKGLAGCAKLLAGWDGLHACCPKRDMFPNADPGELNPKDWPNDNGWLAAAATDPKSPLEVAVVDGEPNIDDVVQVAVGVPKIDEAVVDAVPKIELDDAETEGLPNIVELVEAGVPKTVVVRDGEPKPPVFVVVVDPKIEDTVVAEEVPNIDEAVVFKAFPKIDEVVEVEVPKIEVTVVANVGVPNIDDVVVVLVGVPKIEALVVFVGVPKIEEALVTLELLKIVGVPVVFACVLKIEQALVVFVGVLKIDGATVDLLALKTNVWPVMLEVLPKILAVVGVTKTEVLVEGISKNGVLLVAIGVVKDFSFSGVTGSDTIGVGLSETWGVVSVTLVLLGITDDIVLKLGVVFVFPKIEVTERELAGGSLIEGRVLEESEKLNSVDAVEVKIDLVSCTEVGFETLSLDALKLNVENDVASGFELKLKEGNIASFAETASCLFFDLSSVVKPENNIGVSKGLDKIGGVSKLKLADDVSFVLFILFLIESAKLNVTGVLFFGSVSNFIVDTLVKLKGVFSFASVVPEIISKVDFVETILRELLKFKGIAIDDFKLKSTGSLLVVLADLILLPNNGTELVALNTTGSLGIFL